MNRKDFWYFCDDGFDLKEMRISLIMCSASSLVRAHYLNKTYVRSTKSIINFLCIFLYRPIIRRRWWHRRIYHLHGYWHWKRRVLHHLHRGKRNRSSRRSQLQDRYNSFSLFSNFKSYFFRDLVISWPRGVWGGRDHEGDYFSIPKTLYIFPSRRM